MPIALVLAYLTMLPRLKAEEELAAIRVAQMGTGAVEQRDAQKHVAELERQASGQSKPARAAKASVEGLAAMGIAVALVDGEGRLIDG